MSVLGRTSEKYEIRLSSTKIQKSVICVSLYLLTCCNPHQIVNIKLYLGHIRQIGMKQMGPL